MSITKLKLLSTLFLLSSVGMLQAQVKIGDNPTTIGASSLLELEGTNKGFVLTRVANTAAVTNPVNGMVIYDISGKCVKFYENGVWSACITLGSIDSIEKVLAQIGLEGDSPNTTVSAVTALQMAAAGVTGVVSGNQSLYQAYIDANPNLFSSPATLAEVQAMISLVNNKVTSGGTAVVSAYSCSTASAGSLYKDVPASAVTQTITATVTQIGTYSISITVDGITFAAAGTFAGTGSQNITLTATGTPTSSGIKTFTLNTSPSCGFTRNVGTASVKTITCGSAVSSAPTSSSTAYYYNSSVSIPYTGNTGLPVGAVSVNSTGVTGLTAAMSSFSAAASGNLVFTISGTPSGDGTASFSFTLDGGVSCTFTVAAWLHSLASHTGASSATAAINCKTIKANYPSSTDGTYWLDIDGPTGTYSPQQGYCDMTTDGGGWTLVANYTRTGSNGVRTTRSTLPQIQGTYGANESANTTTWGEVTPAIATVIPFTEARWYAVSDTYTTSSEALHIKSSSATSIASIKAGTGNVDFSSSTSNLSTTPYTNISYAAYNHVAYNNSAMVFGLGGYNASGCSGIQVNRNCGGSVGTTISIVSQYYSDCNGTGNNYGTKSMLRTWVR